MRTLDLRQAADFLKMHPESLRRRAVAKEIPCAKPSKAWVFIDTDLADWIRGQYADRARAVEPGETTCSTKEAVAVIGGSDSPRQTAARYADLLGPKVARMRKSTKPSSSLKSGDKRG